MVILFVLLVIAAGFCCTSCENHARLVTYSIFDVPLDSVTGEVWFPELLADAFGMVNLSSKLCFIGPDKQHLVYLVDEKTGKEWGYAGIVGQGPEDMQARPQYVGKSAKGDTIRLYDYNERKLNTYWVTQTADGLPKLKQVEKKSLLDTKVGKMTNSYMNLCRLDNGFYVGMGYFSESDQFLTLLDKDLNVIKQFGEQPLSGLRSDGKIKNYSGFQGHISVRGNSIFYAADQFSYMARYDISDTGEVTQTWGHQYAYVDYEVYKEWTISFKRCEDNLYGFSDIAIGEKYIFATYSGIPIGEMFKHNSYAIAAQTLVVINKEDGAVLGRFKLSSRSAFLCLSDDEEHLYVMNIDPELQVERIEVDDLLDKID